MIEKLALDIGNVPSSKLQYYEKTKGISIDKKIKNNRKGSTIKMWTNIQKRKQFIHIFIHRLWIISSDLKKA